MHAGNEICLRGKLCLTSVNEALRKPDFDSSNRLGCGSGLDRENSFNKQASLISL